MSNESIKLIICILLYKRFYSKFINQIDNSSSSIVFCQLDKVSKSYIVTKYDHTYDNDHRICLFGLGLKI